MGFVSCQAGANPGGGGGAPICRTKKAMYLNACVWEGMWAWDQIPPRFRVSGPRLFSIQGLCVLVSINTEINTALQSAPFINGVTHLMRTLLTHIELPLRAATHQGVAVSCQPGPTLHLQLARPAAPRAPRPSRRVGKVCESRSVVSHSLPPYGQSTEFSRPEYWSG